MATVVEIIIFIIYMNLLRYTKTHFQKLIPYNANFNQNYVMSNAVRKYETKIVDIENIFSSFFTFTDTEN